MENGFKAMSQNADEGSGGGQPNEEGQGSVASQLKTFGVDTDQMAEATSQRASELQQLIIDEIRARPMRAMGWAVTAGVIFGLWAAK